MTRKQMAFIIAVNAVISAVISVIVALLVIRPSRVASTSAPTVGAPATQAAVAATTTPELVIHVVQSGDTISGLAFKYDVPEEHIIAANNLQNPNFLQVGVELIIPLGGLPDATATFTPAPTATDTPIPFEPPSVEMTATASAEVAATDAVLSTPVPPAGALQIEITEVIGVGEVQQERVIVNNSGDRLADMQGWTLSDADGNKYTFPNFRLWAGGSVTIHTRVGQDGSPPANFYWGKLEAVWTPGEMATLKDAEGEVVSTLVVAPE